jgi:hypothetical protein
MLRRAGLVVLLVVTAFCILDWATSFSSLRPCTKQEADNHGYTAEEKCPTLSSRIFPGRPPVVYAVGDWLEDHNGAVSGLSSALLVAITALLWNLGVEQGKTTRAQLRAYVYFDGPTSRLWPPPPETPNRYSIVIDIINGGATWARNMTVQRTIVKSPNEENDPWSKVDWGAEPGVEAVFGPQQRNSWQFGDVSAQEMDAIKAGTLWMYFVGRIRYRDTFNEIWETHLCRRLCVDAEGHHSFTHCPAHNSADE